MTRILGRTWRAYAIFLAIAALWLYPVALHPRQVPFQPGAQYSDLLISHLANSLFIRRALHEWGSIPLWNPTILSGMPLAADPLSGFWYVPNWLAHIWPSPLAYNILTWAHLGWAGLGLFYLARAEGLGELPSLFAGAMAAGMPKLVAHVGLGHVSLIFAVCWTPWLLLGIRRAMEAVGGTPRAALRWGGVSGGLLGVIALADPRWAPFAAASGLAYGLRVLAPWRDRPHGKMRGALAAGLMAAATSGGIASGLMLPLLELTRLSTRANLLPGERSAFALPAAKGLGLFLPDLGGYAEYQIYAGEVALMLAVFALALRPRATLFWLGSGLAALVFALGDSTPLYGWVNGLAPGLHLLRVPSRSLFLLGFCLAFAGGLGLDLWSRRAWNPASAKRARLAIASLTLFLLLLSLGAGWLLPQGDQNRLGFTLYVPAIALLTAALLLSGMRQTEIGPGPRLALIVLAMLELAWVDGSYIEMRPNVARFEGLEGDLSSCLLDERSRLLSPSYSLPQQTAARYGLQIADGVNPLQLSSYRDYMARAMGFSADRYSVTLPPFPDGDPNRNWEPEMDVPSLARLSIACVISAFPVESAGLTWIDGVTSHYVYRLDETRPRAWILRSGGEAAAAAEVERIDWSPNRINITAQGPGRLVLSEVDYPGWVARVDGRRVEVEPAFGLLRSIELPPESHEVELIFLPWTVFLGAALSAAASAVVLWTWIRR